MRFSTQLVAFLLLSVPAVFAAPVDEKDTPQDKSGHGVKLGADGRPIITEAYNKKDMPEHRQHLIDNQKAHPENKGPFTVGQGGNRDPLLANYQKVPGTTSDEKPRDKLEHVKPLPAGTSRQDVSSVQSLALKEQPKEGGLSSGTTSLSKKLEAETGKKPHVLPVAVPPATPQPKTGNTPPSSPKGLRSGKKFGRRALARRQARRAVRVEA